MCEGLSRPGLHISHFNICTAPKWVNCFSVFSTSFGFLNIPLRIYILVYFYRELPDPTLYRLRGDCTTQKPALVGGAQLRSLVVAESKMHVRHHSNHLHGARGFDLIYMYSKFFSSRLYIVSYTSALKLDLLKIQKKTHIKTTCLWHELRDPRPCYPGELARRGATDLHVF
jgi:hypothetical protein